MILLTALTDFSVWLQVFDWTREGRRRERGGTTDQRKPGNGKNIQKGEFSEREVECWSCLISFGDLIVFLSLCVCVCVFLKI